MNRLKAANAVLLMSDKIHSCSRLKKTLESIGYRVRESVETPEMSLPGIKPVVVIVAEDSEVMSAPAKKEKTHGRQFRCGPLSMDMDDQRINVAGRRVRLTGKEFALLCVLAKKAGKVVSHHQIIQKIWGGGSFSRLASLRVCACSLRRKLRNPLTTDLILTEQGVGYRLDDSLPA